MTFLNFPNDFQAFIWSAKDVPSHSFFSAVLGMRHLVPLLCGQLPRESALYRWMRNIHELKCFLFVQVLRKLNAKICPARSSPPLSLISMLAKQGARTNFRPNSEEPLYSRMPWRDLSPLQLASGIFSSRPHICHTMRLVWKPSDHTFFLEIIQAERQDCRDSGLRYLLLTLFALFFFHLRHVLKIVANIRKQDEAKRPKQNTSNFPTPFSSTLPDTMEVTGFIIQVLISEENHGVCGLVHSFGFVPKWTELWNRIWVSGIR